MHWLFDISSYDYDLPESCIAQEPTIPQDRAKLLVYRNKDISDTIFSHLPDVLEQWSVLFFNDTKVMQSRVVVKNKKCLLKTGIDALIQEGEIFVYQIHDDNHMEVLVSDGKHYRPWSIIYRNDTITLYSESFTQEGIMFRIQWMSSYQFLEKYGQLPLPPYIAYTDEKSQWYQTCFASYIGSAAAPTASLHFTPELLTSLTQSWYKTDYATLHVWLGTFKPVYQEDIRKHDIHQEYAKIDTVLFTTIAQYKKTKNPIVAVGTTMMRLLESLPYLWKIMQLQWLLYDDFNQETKTYRDHIAQDISQQQSEKYIDPQSIQYDEKNILFQTKIFIYPWFVFRVVNSLITNFHLPKSSLLMLVAACIGDERKEIYQHAIQNNYRFYSFGDGLLIQTGLHGG